MGINPNLDFVAVEQARGFPQIPRIVIQQCLWAKDKAGKVLDEHGPDAKQLCSVRHRMHLHILPPGLCLWLHFRKLFDLFLFELHMKNAHI